MSYTSPSTVSPLTTLHSWQTGGVMRTTLLWIMHRKVQCSHSTAGALHVQTDRTIFCLWQNSETYQTAAKQNAGDDWLRRTATTSGVWRGGEFVWVLQVGFSSYRKWKQKIALCNFGTHSLRFSGGILSWIPGCWICWCNIHTLASERLDCNAYYVCLLFKMCNDNPEIQDWSDDIGIMLMLTSNVGKASEMLKVQFNVSIVLDC